MTSQNRLLAQAILRRDPLAFFERSLPAIMPGAEYIPNWHIRAMAAVVDEMISGDTRRYIINIQPRMGKSLFFSVSLPMWFMRKVY